MDWSGVDYLRIIVMFLSAVWTIILTAPIQSIHWWDTDAMLHFSKFDEKQLIYISDGLRVSTFPANFQFWLNYSFMDSDSVLVYDDHQQQNARLVFLRLFNAESSHNSI